MIIRDSEPASFYHPKHIHAQIIWFSKGYLEYIMPLELPLNVTIKSLELSMELCSEAPNFDNEWLSDISVRVNGIEIGMWTSPGDFGDHRGRLNPSWWLDRMTQYGLLKTWRVEGGRTTMDMKKVSGVGIGDLQLEGRPYLRLQIGVDSNADHKGGMSIFGRQFGDYEQDIKMRIHYVPHNR
ncbi:hypothetical protein [Paenibacillus sp. XY044]|uniref:hypothetical protein n=1 Tax=Paenibacillus sp. XY044 TaxID=2026089 RepID=UPI002795D4EB|nr:hypothetical protein [Paenibacillus sp. XY044]